MVTASNHWRIHGNASAVDRFRRDADHGVRHAYLLAGPESVGKTLLARSFATALLCQEVDAGSRPCGECSTCRRIHRGVHPDVTTFDLAYQATHQDTRSKNLTLNIKTVREIASHLALRPVEADWRVAIVDDVESMQEPAQEAFLKTLEEPPSYAVILLLTTDAELLLPTVLSRCALVQMSPATRSQVVEALVEHGADLEHADRIAAAARGRVGLALTARDDSSVEERLTATMTAATAWIAGDAYSRMVEAFRLADRFAADRQAVFDHLLAAEVGWREQMIHDMSAAGLSGDVVSGKVRALTSIDRCLRDLDANVRPRSALATMVQQWPPTGQSR